MSRTAVTSHGLLPFHFMAVVQFTKIPHRAARLPRDSQDEKCREGWLCSGWREVAGANSLPSFRGKPASSIPEIGTPVTLLLGSFPSYASLQAGQCANP